MEKIIENSHTSDKKVRNIKKKMTDVDGPLSIDQCSH